MKVRKPWSSRLASPYERPDCGLALARLDVLCGSRERAYRARSRAHRAETELTEARSKGGSIADPSCCRWQRIGTWSGNQSLRRRLTNARAYERGPTRLVFLEDRTRRPDDRAAHRSQSTIGGEEFTVRSELPPSTRWKSRRTSTRSFEIRSGMQTGCPKVAILVGLAVTDELFQARRGDTEIAGPSLRWWRN